MFNAITPLLALCTRTYLLFSRRRMNGVETRMDGDALEQQREFHGGTATDGYINCFNLVITRPEVAVTNLHADVHPRVI